MRNGLEEIIEEITRRNKIYDLLDTYDFSNIILQCHNDNDDYESLFFILEDIVKAYPKLQSFLSQLSDQEKLRYFEDTYGFDFDGWLSYTIMGQANNFIPNSGGSLKI